MNTFGHEATESPAEEIVSAPMTLTNMRCQNSLVGGSGQTVVYTLEKNGSDTSITATINTGATSASDLTHSVSFAAGDTFSVKSALSATTGNITGGTCTFNAQS
jgi:hypothetical protein